MRLSGKTAIITGGGRGLGKAIALSLAKRGINIVICSTTKSELEQTKKEILNLGVKCIAIRADVRKYKDIKNVVQRTMKKFKRIDIHVNNAGIAFLKLLHKTSEKEWDNMININLKGTFLFCKEVVPIMLKKKSGIIINISSGAGLGGFPEFSAYCASKFGIIGLTESLAPEVEAKGIKVYAICPGSINTEMYHKLQPQRSATNLNRPLLEAEYIAEKIVKMCITHQKFKTGSAIEIYK